MNAWMLLLLPVCSAAWADDFATLCTDRAALERVYYQHRLGTKPSFAEALPQATLETLVRLDLRKEAVLRDRYGVVLTPALVSAEVHRINTTTRAPEMLAEIKTALGNDPEKLARVFAKPILVERLLRDKFDNDDALHAGIRRECEQVRQALLTAKTNGAGSEQLLAQLRGVCSNAVTETTWQLAPRPVDTNAPKADELEVKRRYGPEARLLAAPAAGESGLKFYFDELPEVLQKILSAQLRRPGDVSAVIEMPGGFLLYLACARTERALSVAILSLPKRSYEQWLDSESGAGK